MKFRPFAQRFFSRLFLAMLGFSLMAQQALAQEEASGPKVKSYALPYLLVALMLILGFTLTLRPSMRHKEFRPKVD